MPANSWNLPPGLNNVGSYQVSGRPYISGSCLAPASGSALVLRFPVVTKWFQIEPHSSIEDRELRVAFSENGLYGKGGSNFKVHLSSSLCRPLDFKVSEIWFMSEDASDTATFDLVAGLTNIPKERTSTETSASAAGLWAPDGSTTEAGGPNWSGSLGVS
tara:strand:- start:603 stop:1082 length:480 start_codon:yes stop_codon:yes gene_type:complete